MSEGIKQTFVTALTDTSTTAKEPLGSIRFGPTGKVYKYVKYSAGTGTVAAVAGSCVVWHGDDGMADFEVTMDYTDGVLAAGILQAVIAAGSYGWIQTKGPATMVPAFTAGADGDQMTTVGAADGALDVVVSGAINGNIAGYAIDITAKLILLDCPWQTATRSGGWKRPSFFNMTITPENIRDDIVGNLGNRTDIKDVVIYRMIHYAQLRISRLKAFNELHSRESILTSAGDIEYVFPSAVDARRIRKIDSIMPQLVSDFSYEKVLTRIPTIKQWNRLLGGTETVSPTTNTPYFYFRRLVTELQFYPVPDDIYNMIVDYTLYPVQITEFNKTEEVGLYNADDILLFLASSILSYRVGREKDGEKWFNLYRGSVKEMLAEEVDYGDFDMVAVHADMTIGSPTDYWADPFFKHSGTSQVI